MMGHRQVEQAALFYEFSLERHIPADHLLRSIDRFVDLEQVRQDLAPFYSEMRLLKWTTSSLGAYRLTNLVGRYSILRMCGLSKPLFR